MATEPETGEAWFLSWMGPAAALRAWPPCVGVRMVFRWWSVFAAEGLIECR